MGGLAYLHTALEKTSGPNGRIILFTHCTRENKWTLWEDYPIYTLHSRKQVDPMGGLSYLHTALEKTSGPNGRIILFTHCTRENKWTLWEDYPIYTLHSRKQVDPMGGLFYLHTASRKQVDPMGGLPIYTLHSRKQVDPMGGLSYLHTALEKTSGPNGRIILFTHCTRENKWTLWEDYPIYTLHSRIKQVENPMGGLSYLHTALEKTSGPYGRIILHTALEKTSGPMGRLSYLHTALEETSGSYGRIILLTHCTRENKWIMGGLAYLHTALEKTSGPYGRIILFTHCTRENKWTLWEDYPIYTLDSRKQVDPMGGLSYLHTGLEKTSGPYGRIILFTHCTRENKWTLWEDYPIYTLHSRKQVDPMGGLSLHTSRKQVDLPTHCTRENKWTLWEDYPIYTLHSRKQVDPTYALEKTSGLWGD